MVWLNISLYLIKKDVWSYFEMEGIGLDLWYYEGVVLLEFVDWYVVKDCISVLMMIVFILNSILKEIECNFKYIVERIFVIVVVY